MHDVEILTGLDSEGTPASIMLRFQPRSDEGDLLVFDTAAEAREWADGVEEKARAKGVSDPQLYGSLEDLRNRADQLEAAE